MSACQMFSNKDFQLILLARTPVTLLHSYNASSSTPAGLSSFGKTAVPQSLQSLLVLSSLSDWKLQAYVALY